MKLLELTIEGLQGLSTGTYSFGDARGAPLAVAVRAGDDPTSLLEVIASLLELVRHPGPAPHRLAWWAKWRGPGEARLSACWALTPGEAALAGLRGRTAVSEWRFGPHDGLPREILVEGLLPWGARTVLARYVYANAHEIDVWMEADPLVELLAGIARRDVAATRVACLPGKGIVGSQTPDTLAVLTQAIAPLFPALRLERVSPAQGEAPVACFREGARVELDQLPDVERNAIHLVAAIHAGDVRGGVVLVCWPEIHTPADAPTRWLDWATGLASAHEAQLIMAATDHGAERSTCHKVVEHWAEEVAAEHVQGCAECQENMRTVRAMRSLDSGTPSDGREEAVQAGSCEHEARQSTGDE